MWPASGIAAAVCIATVWLGTATAATVQVAAVAAVLFALVSAAHRLGRTAVRASRSDVDR